MSSTPTSRTHHAAIVNDHGRYLVAPGHLVATAGDEIAFHSAAAGRVTLHFPTPVLMDAHGAPVERCELPDNGTATFRVADRERVRPGSYTYLAYCTAADELALGGSQPKIIIYR